MGVKAWSNNEENRLIEMYTNETQDVNTIADSFGKGYRSVISKLVNLGIYQKPSSSKNSGKTVKTMLRELEELLKIEIDGFNLNKKSNLLVLVEAIRSVVKEN